MGLVQTDPIKAVVAYIMDEKCGEYGPYQSVLFESSGLQDGKLWRALKPDEARQLQKGQAVELTPATTSSGKDSWNIRLLDNQPPQAVQHSQPQPVVRSPQSVQTQPATQSLPPYQAQTRENRRQQIESFIFSMAKLHAICYQAAEQAYDGKSAPDEVIRAATSSIFIAAERRFRLCSPAD